MTVHSPDPGMDGMTGTVVDETKHTIMVARSSLPEAMVPKRGQRFTFRTREGEVEIQGDRLTYRPEQRTKKIRG